MQKVMERAGTSDKGTISALYTVLVEGDDFNEPISDAARGILDGHIMLSRKMASLEHYPAIDTLESISRVMSKVIFEDHLKSARRIKELLAIYKQSEDLISIGAYQRGTNPKTDKAIEMYDKITQFLRQEDNISTEWEDTIQWLNKLSEIIK
jgi:flagellum-specific ATP synthase